MPNNGPLTTGQAAQYCHVSQATVVNWIKDGKLAAYTTPGGHRRIPRSDMVSFLKAHNMPIDPALKEPPGPRLLLVGDSPRIRRLAQAMAERNSFVISVAESDYEASAEVVRSEPDAVIIDMETSADPLGLCRWLSGTAENVAVVVIGEGNEKGPALAAGADVYTAGDAVASLKTRIRTLLE